jgi:hypothetical protein
MLSFKIAQTTPNAIEKNNDGPAGSTGPTGSTGPSGPTGPTGPQSSVYKRIQLTTQDYTLANIGTPSDPLVLHQELLTNDQGELLCKWNLVFRANPVVGQNQFTIDLDTTLRDVFPTGSYVIVSSSQANGNAGTANLALGSCTYSANAVRVQFRTEANYVATGDEYIFNVGLVFPANLNP